MNRPLIIAGARVAVRIHNGHTGEDTGQVDYGTVTRVLRGGGAADVKFDDDSSCVVECSRITALPGRYLPDVHPTIAKVMDHALDTVGINHYHDNGWHGLDAVGDGNRVVRLTAEGNDPDEGVRLIVFTDLRETLVAWTASFDASTPLPVLSAAFAEALK